MGGRYYINAVGSPFCGGEENLPASQTCQFKYTHSFSPTTRPHNIYKCIYIHAYTQKQKQKKGDNLEASTPPLQPPVPARHMSKKRRERERRKNARSKNRRRLSPSLSVRPLLTQTHPSEPYVSLWSGIWSLSLKEKTLGVLLRMELLLDPLHLRLVQAIRVRAAVHFPKIIVHLVVKLTAATAIGEING